MNKKKPQKPIVKKVNTPERPKRKGLWASVGYFQGKLHVQRHDLLITIKYPDELN